MSPAIARFVVGLVTGAVVGFFAANVLDRPATAPPPAAAPAPAEPEGPSLSSEELTRAMATVDERPDDYEAQFKMGEALLRIGQRPADAVRYYERAAALRPGAVDAHVGLADARFATALATAEGEVYDARLLDAAASSYERAIELAPDRAGLHAALGMTRVVRRPPELDRAERAFRRALELDPANDLAKRGLEMAGKARRD